MSVAARARALIEAYHAGRLDRRRLAEGLGRLFAEEFAQSLAPALDEARREAAGDAGAASPDPAHGPAPAAVPGAPALPGLWLLLVADACHFCGRRGLPVMALRSTGDPDEEAPWVHLCLEDLEAIRDQARALLDPEGEGRPGIGGRTPNPPAGGE